MWDTKLFMFLNLTSYGLAVSLRTARCNNKNLYVVFALRCVFCADLRTDSGLCCIYH